MKNILFVHPQFEMIGGAELVALRIMERLVLNYNLNINLLTLKSKSIDELAKSTDIKLPSSSINIQAASCPKWLLRAESKFHLLKLAYLHRHAKKIAPMFDFCIGTYNEIDFGRVGFQYIHNPNFANRKFLHKYKMIGSKNILDIFSLFEFLYKKYIYTISGNTIEGFRRNITAVNSHFIQDIIKQIYGIEGHVIYPALLIRTDKVNIINWEERDFQFVTVGRISPDKHIIDIIDYYEIISSRFPNAKFLIIGRIGDIKYYKNLLQRINSSQVRIELLTDIDDSLLKIILSKSKFYISVKQYEHFGISVLEAVNAGCLTFVHDSGGQREIIAPPILRYCTPLELCEKVSMLTKDSSLINETLKVLRESAKKFSIDEFNEQIDTILQPLINT